MAGFVSSSADIGLARAQALGARAPQAPTAGPAKARAAAQDFEAVFVNSMFQQMFTGIDGDGPFGGSKGVGVWRSFLTDEYSRSFVKAGGIGIADQVYRELLKQQESKSAESAPVQEATP